MGFREAGRAYPPKFAGNKPRYPGVSKRPADKFPCNLPTRYRKNLLMARIARDTRTPCFALGGPVGEYCVQKSGKSLFEFFAAQPVYHLAPNLRRLDQSCGPQQLEVV